MPDHVLDGVLERFATRGPEFGGGLANHGPMAAEALVAMGRGEEVERWSEWYSEHLIDPPDARNPIAPEAWPEALGDMRRAGDWIAYFRRALAEAPWRDVLDTWIGRLGPGIIAGATHGVLRVAHAVRALDRAETPQRIDELALGLAYWAARYQLIPDAAVAAAPLSVGDALARLSPLEAGANRTGLIFKVVGRLTAENIEGAAGLVRVDDSAVDAFVSDVTATFVRQYVANAPAAGVAFIHTVTAPSALRSLAPHLQPETLRRTMRYAWQACAAIYVAYGREPAPAIAAGDAVPDRDDLIAQAVAARDEHAIKFTEACLKEHAIRPDPAFLLAARDACERLAVRD